MIVTLILQKAAEFLFGFGGKIGIVDHWRFTNSLEPVVLFFRVRQIVQPKVKPPESKDFGVGLLFQIAPEFVFINGLLIYLNICF
jgi:hypothetical protein